MIEITLSGIAALITAITGAFSLAISIYLIFRIKNLQKSTKHIEYLTNSNYSKMVALLSEAVESARQSSERESNRQNDTEPEE